MLHTGIVLEQMLISKFKQLIKTLFKNTTLTFLNLENDDIGSKSERILADALCKNTMQTSLNLSWSNLKSREKAFCVNIPLIYLSSEGEKVLADVFCSKNFFES